LTRRQHRIHEDDYRSGWEPSNLFKLAFEVFIFAPFRLARHNIVSTDQTSIGNIILDYLSCVCTVTCFALFKQWTIVSIIIGLVAVPLIIRYTIKFVKNKTIKNAQKENNQTTTNDQYNYVRLSSELNQKINEPSYESMQKVDYIAPNFNAMSDTEVQKRIDDLGVKLRGKPAKQQGTRKVKTTSRIINEQPDFNSMDDDTLRTWVSNNADKITVRHA